MSRLDPSVIALDKGLNLQTAKILAPAGSALSSLNYEQVDFQGQKRIEGYTSYDGNLLSAIDEFYVIESSIVEVIDGLVYSGDKFLGRLLDQYGEDLHVAVYDFKILESLQYSTGTETFTASEHYELLLTYNSTLRGLVESLPGAVIGLHWFNDRLYAVADVGVIQLQGTGLGILPRTVLTTANGSREVLSSQDINGSTVIYVDGTNLGTWITSDTTEVESDSGFYTLETVGSVDSEEVVASIFEARTEVQATTEDGSISGADFGWKFKHNGWQITFKDGFVPYGGLTAINQNREGVGIQGPTSTTGNNGRPLSLLQKVSIANDLPQVNGWKTSDTPESYNLDPLALSDVDSDYIYADFYLEWDSDTNQITTPDATSTALAERSATSKVEIEI